MSMKKALLKIFEAEGILQEEMRKTKNVKDFQKLLKRKEQEKQIRQMGFQSIEELQKALKDYREKNFPEDCIHEQDIDFSFLDDIQINYDDIDIDFDLTFLDEIEINLDDIDIDIDFS